MAKVCDCFPELKEITEARERRYRTQPEKEAPEGPQSFVEVKVTSIGQLNELVECKKSGYKFVISEPVHVGGQNCAPTPLEFLLSGAVGCYAAVFAFFFEGLEAASERLKTFMLNAARATICFPSTACLFQTKRSTGPAYSGARRRSRSRSDSAWGKRRP